MKSIQLLVRKISSILLLIGIVNYTWAYTVPLDQRTGSWAATAENCYLKDLGNGVWKYDFDLVPKQFYPTATQSYAVGYLAIYAMTYYPNQYRLADTRSFADNQVTITPNDSYGSINYVPNGQSGPTAMMRVLSNEPIYGSTKTNFFTTAHYSGIVRNDPTQYANGLAYPGVLIFSYATTPTNGSLFNYYWATFTGNGQCKVGNLQGPTDPEPEPTLDPKFSLTSPNWSMKPVKLSDLSAAELALNLNNSYNETLSSEQICIDYDKAAVKSTVKWRLSASSVNGKVTRNGTNLFTLLGPTISSTGVNSKAYYAVELNPTDPNSGMKKQYLPQQTFYTESASDLTLPTSTNGTRNKACWTPKINLFKGAAGSQETGPGLHNDNMLLLITPST